MSEPRILYRDEDLVAVYKPAGLLSHPSADPSRPDLVNWLRAQIEAERLVMHHRLDLETSGLLVLTHSLRACAPMAQAFEQRRIRKTYLARVLGKPPRQGRIDQPLAETSGRVRADRHGKEAVTEFLRLQLEGNQALLELRPLHGRKHQLRVHCQSRGWPITGDKLYGGAASSRLWLHAWRLQFEHPVSGEPLTLECPTEEDWGYSAVSRPAKRR
ncbi:hypothetical protein ABS71_09000 [bacterium SCN 62-11]|nr:RluA family pseudouridine synthase [Candidatus Eremiobacteraeota bacterium]ODT69471.1 MAG: hypothetical protein ABS71_09000 [bacterium SCN 62-11]